MNEHDDDLEPEVEENAEYETAEFPVLEDTEENERQEKPATKPEDDDALDPDDSEV